MSPSTAAVPAKPARLVLFSRNRVAQLLRFSALQVMVQVLGFVVGIVLVRHLPQRDYGWFTTVLTLVSLGSVLLDLGLSTAVLSQGGGHHAEPTRLANLLGDAFRLQRWLLAFTLLPLLAYAGFLLSGQGATWPLVPGLMVLALLTAWLQARNAIWMTVVRLRSNIPFLQRLDLGFQLGRLALTGLLALVMAPFGVVAAGLTVLLPAAAASLALRRQARQALGAPAPAERGAFTPGLRAFVARQAPNSLYYCIAAQIPVWAVGWFGQAERVAEVGALGRLAVIFAVIGSVLTGLVQPYFARPRQSRELLQTLVMLNALFAGFTGLLVLCAWLLPGPLLWLLGPHYTGLHTELIWMVLAASLASWSGAVYGLGSARGWVVPTPWVVLPAAVTVVAACRLLDLATVTGALQLQAAMAGVTAVVVLTHVAGRMRHHLHQEPAN